MKKIISLILSISLVAVLFAGCGKNKANEVEDVAIEGNVYALMTMESGEGIMLELYPSVAPITVSNFVKLTNEGFYDGLTFHRIIAGFMIQGGDPDGDGIGGSDEQIKGEFAANGVENNLKHTRGVISMARTNDPNSASSQFFIMHDDAPHLDGNYAAFGKVIAGMEVVDKIATVETGMNDRPLEPQVIKSIKIIDLNEMLESASETAE